MNTILSLPFVPLADLLRSLSLWGTAGNLLAIVLYVVISLLPAGLWLLLRAKKCQDKTDLLLPFMSVFLFFMLYEMINPFSVDASMADVWKSCLNITFFSFAVFYLALRLPAICDGEDMGRIYLCLKLLLWFVFAFYLLSAILTLTAIPSSIEAVRAVNTALVSSELSLTYGMMILGALVSVIPMVLCMAILLLGRRLLLAAERDLYSDEVICISKKLGRVCRIFLTVSTALQLGFNLLQLLLHDILYILDTATVIPLGGFLLAIITLLLTRYLILNQKLKEENHAFI